MGSSLDWKVTRLASGESLRAEGAGSQSVAIFRGMVWITRESDTQGVFLSAGESVALDRPGLHVVQAIIDSDLLVFDASVGAGLQDIASQPEMRRPDRTSVDPKQRRYSDETLEIDS